mmetsp:Transcript_6341/g.15785  ORF Transcript_6341/g.15785 Transcript_6341/m.15785 type:complete len:548 (+) Transcript_6341:145-1788(+)|eukprot:CAMPEP_0181107762 /NCGR_PEP_ID=MMETSP1071-20121207/17259_1 /TAXON_ID=35127 /ORGANISM="Thalassiosira sp., Strain NH16" /LENGTH=547 /DNA_ID=CAMNT_0023191299 /DNA_START=37 /DNA_END=1680 /DNA_ORIENTATION=-
MAARETIDLADSSSDEDEEGNRSPDLLADSSNEDEKGYNSPGSLSPSNTPPRARQRSHYQSRKRGPSDIINVLSSPPFSPEEMSKSKREKKLEALERARQWCDNRKRDRTDREANGSAGSREVINLSSPSSPAPNRRTGGGEASASAEGVRSPTPKKMSAMEKQAAKARARQWHENRHANNLQHLTEEEVGGLSSQESDSSSVKIIDRHRQRDNHHSNAASSNLNGEARQYQPFAARMGESTRRGSPQPRSHPARSVAAASSRIARGSQREETQQWACPRCTLLNNQHQAICGACHHDNPSRRHNDGRSEGGRVYDVDIDGRFVPESEHNHHRSAQIPTFSNSRIQSAARTTAARSSHANGHGLVSSGAMASAIGGSSFSDMMAREMLQQPRAFSNDAGWGRPRGISRTSFGSVRNHMSAMGYGISGSNYSQLLQSMQQQANALRHLPGQNLDNMSYEQMLELFGDGSENRGASSQAISSLPVSRIGNPESELPEDKRQCSICLEDFCQGDERTSLPCLHGFHSGCVNRWLSSNGSCPVCKTSVSEG